MCHAQLTGDYKKDIPFLEQKSKEYAKEENGAELVNALAEMAFSLLPEEEQAKLRETSFIDGKRLDALYHEAEQLIRQKKMLEAEAILSQISDKIEEQFGEGKQPRAYFSFRNPFEYHMYLEFYATSKEFGRAPFDFSKYLLSYGYVLIELKQLEQAEAVLERSIRFNPMNPDARFELAELFKLKHQWDKLLAQTQENIKIACSSYLLARCYCDMGFYCVETQDYASALCFYYQSLFYMESRPVRMELRMLEQQMGGKQEAPTRVQVEQACAKYKVPDGPSQQIIELACVLADGAEQQNRMDLAAFFCRIAWDLTRDKRFAEKCKELDEAAKKQAE